MIATGSRGSSSICRDKFRLDVDQHSTFGLNLDVHVKFVSAVYKDISLFLPFPILQFICVMESLQCSLLALALSGQENLVAYEGFVPGVFAVSPSRRLASELFFPRSTVSVPNRNLYWLKKVCNH